MNLLEIAILFVKVVQIERAPETGASAAYDNDVCGGDHQEDADAAAARECVLQRERGRGIDREREAYIEQLFLAYPHSLAAFLLGATVLLEADNGAAQQTDGALLGHLVAVEARSFVVVLQAEREGKRNQISLGKDQARERA